MAVRVDQLVPYGYTDTAIATFHAFGDGLIRQYALELGLPTGPPRPDPPRGRDLPARAPLRVRSRRLPAARRPDPLPGGARDPVQPLQGRGHQPGRLPRVRRPCRGRGGEPRGGRGGRPAPRRQRRDGAALEEGRRQDELARAYATLPGPARGERLHRLRRPGRAGAAAGARVAGRPGRDRGPLPVHPGRRVPGHEPRPVRARRAPRRRAPQHHGRRATTTRRSTRSAAPRSTTSSASATATARPGPSSCAGTTARRRRSSTPPTG